MYCRFTNIKFKIKQQKVKGLTRMGTEDRRIFTDTAMPRFTKYRDVKKKASLFDVARGQTRRARPA
jgi:hypothetical protein